jgi:hypothetical protein
MNYQRIYDAIIERAKLRGLNKKLLDGYFERHHIIPKCMNGTNNKDNLVLLTAREHYLCHWLLWKANKENYKLFYAYHIMTTVKSFKLSSKQFEIIKYVQRNVMSVLKKGKKFSATHKENIKRNHFDCSNCNNSFFGKIHSEESRDKIKLAWVERRKTPMTKDVKLKHSEQSLGRKWYHNNKGNCIFTKDDVDCNTWYPGRS